MSKKNIQMHVALKSAHVYWIISGTAIVVITKVTISPFAVIGAVYFSIWRKSTAMIHTMHLSTYVHS